MTNRAIAKSAVIAAAAVMTIAAAACKKEQREYIALSGSMLGTTVNIQAQIEPHKKLVLQQKVAEVNRQMIEQMSIYNPQSLISKINNNQSDSITPWMQNNILLADSISRLSNGVYDITVAPIVKAWGFAKAGANAQTIDPQNIPQPNIDSIMHFVGYNKIEIQNGKIIKSDPRVQIDLNSIAKGFAVDKLAQEIESLDVENYMVEIGGEIRVAGRNSRDTGWRVGIEVPQDEEKQQGAQQGGQQERESNEQEEEQQRAYEVRIEIAPQSTLKAIATSGNYRRFYRNARGEKIVHIVDPKTGKPKESKLLSATVLAQTCAHADAYATMLMAAGDKQAHKLAKQIEECEVYLIYSDNTTYISPKMKEMIMAQEK